MSLLLTSIALHTLLTMTVPSSWWVPDLTLVGLVCAVARSPSQWLMLSGVAGLWTMAWAIRFPLPILVGSLIVGWTVRVLADRLDLADMRVQCLVMASASLFMTLGALWLENLYLLRVFGLAAWHVAITILAVPCVQGLLE